MLDAKLKFSTALHPHIGRQIEAVNRSLGNLLKTLVGEHLESWDLKLSIAKFSYNTYINRTTSRSPHEIVYGFRLKQPIDLIPVANY